VGSQRDGNVADAAARRRDAALAGHRADETGARALLGDADAAVRATALGALARLGRVVPEDVLLLLDDPAAAVRRRACEVAAGADLVSVGPALVTALGDGDDSVAEVAAWALGELSITPPGAVDALASVVVGHRDPLCREAAVAALGAIGDEVGLPAILVATKDKPAVRRRAVLALAPFEGPDVEAALEAALLDRDWQVRQAAEDLSDPLP
jgi:HEAT repeat protein